MLRFFFYLVFVFATAALAAWGTEYAITLAWEGAEGTGAVAALVVGLYTFFFAALHVPLQPEVSDVFRFLWRYLILHLVAAGVPIGLALLARWIVPGLSNWLPWLVGVLALIVSYYGAYALLFDGNVGKEWQRGQRLVAFRVALQRANAARRQGDPGLFWGGLLLPSSVATKHFLIIGAVGSGKTLTMRLLMQDVLPRILPGSDCRALIYDAKQDMLPLLSGMGLQCEILTLNPFDERCVAWDMAADVTSPATAYQVASILIPEEKNSSQPFFSDAARDLLSGAMTALSLTRRGQWTFRDLILILQSPRRLRQLLASTRETRHLLVYLTEERTAMDILATISTKIAPFRPIAAAWSRAERAISLREWIEGEFILVLGNDESCRAPIDAINRVIFQRLTELTLSQSESETRSTWFFLDEIRSAGRLESLHHLMIKVRSKGGAVALSMQDTDGLRDVYGEARANEILAQCAQKAIFRLESPLAAKWASDLVGHYDAVELRASNSWGDSGQQGNSGGRSNNSSGWSRTVSFAEQNVKREAVLPAEFMSIPLTNEQNGLSGYYLSPVTGVYHSTLTPQELGRKLCPHDPDVPDAMPRPESDQLLGGDDEPEEEDPGPDWDEAEVMDSEPDDGTGRRRILYGHGL